MASIRKRSPWRVIVDKDTANAAVFDTFKQAVAAARTLVVEGTVLGFVQKPRKGQAIGPETALVERVPGGSWSVRIRRKSAPELNKSFDRKSDAEEWTAQREGDHALARIRMSILQASDIVTYRDERVKVVKGATVKKELELLARVIAIARAEWGIHMATNPASGRLVKRPAPQDGDVRDRRLAEVHLAVKGNPPPASDPVDVGAPPTKPGPASRRVRPDEAYEDDPEITALLAMPHSEQQALLRACRYPAWFTQRKREVTAATLKARLKRNAKAPIKARLLGGCRLWAISRMPDLLGPDIEKSNAWQSHTGSRVHRLDRVSVELRQKLDLERCKTRARAS
jgi:hypothetical protein